MKRTTPAMALGCGLAVHAAAATDVTLHLKGVAPVTKVRGRFACDAAGVKLGFTVFDGNGDESKKRRMFQARDFHLDSGARCA